MLHRRLNIYKHQPWVNEGYDPSNGGISGRLDEIEVFSDDATIEQIEEWCEKTGTSLNDVCRLNKRMLWGEPHYYIEPVVRDKGKIGPMFGGNYACTSDATWADMLGHSTGYPVPIHDRFETQEQYDLLSC